MSHFSDRLSTKLLAWFLTITVPAAYIVWPDMAEASHLGSSTASAGNSFLPVQQNIQAFQPDLFTGRAATAIPILVPPGRKGMQPSLALSYASSNRNSWLGVGWDLNLGYIERLTKNGPPRYDTSDAFVFNFQGVQSELVQIPDGSYRAKDEGLFLKFTFNGTSWEVRDKSGTKYLFGTLSTSRIDQPSGTFRWCLEKVVDTNGNYLEISYVSDQGMLYPAEIRYTGHEPTSEAPAHRVVFTLEDRPDRDQSWRSGSAIVVAKRLKEIAVYANTSQLARKYVVSYTLSPRTQRSLLTSVQQLGTDGTTSLPAQTFTYQEDALGYLECHCGNPPQNQPHWNLRYAAVDLGHDNFGALHPYAGLPWSSPILDQGGSGSASAGNVSWSIGSDGSIQLRGNSDHHLHAWTYVYVSSGKSLSLSLNKIDCDSNASLWVEDGSGVRQVNPGGFGINAGWSILHVTDYHQHDCFSSRLSGPVSQVESMNASLFTEPQLTGDFTGDGVTDLMIFTAGSGKWEVAVGNTLGFKPKTTWLTGFGGSSDTALLGDFDADGKADLALFNGGTWRFAKSTGSSWQADGFLTTSTDGGTPLVGDFNGDGLADIGVVTSSGTWLIRLNTGNGTFQGAQTWLSSWGGGQKAIGGDFNGDGFTDVGYVDGSQRVYVALSTGTTFQAQGTAWHTNFPGQATVTSGDLNGDGLTDLAYLSGSQVMACLSEGTQLGDVFTLFSGFTLSGSAVQLQLADYNGDGLVEAGVFSSATGESQLSFSVFRQPDLLSTISNGVGGTTALTYTPSSAFDNTGESTEKDGLPDLPFVLPVVTQVAVADGRSHTYMTTYAYAGGRYDAATKEFRGFRRVDVREAANPALLHRTWFYQTAAAKGRAQSQIAWQPGVGEFQRLQNWYGTATPYAGVTFTALQTQDVKDCNADATCRVARTWFYYDAYGNLQNKVELGEEPQTDDNRQTTYVYAVNEAAWIVNTPCEVHVHDGTHATSGPIVARHRFEYDGATSYCTAPTQGRLTQEREWLTGDVSVPGATWLRTQMTYDAYGNVATVKDALNRTTTNVYDTTTHTYLTSITNALGHTRTLEYDTRLGVVTSSTDPNGQTSRTVYDALGRVTSVIGPTDTDTLPTVSYEYDLSTTPIKTVARTRVNSGEAATLDVYTFADGLGRTLQTRSPAEQTGKQVVTGDVEFDARGLVAKAYLPYLGDQSTSYQPPATTFAAVTYEYDLPGRLTKVTDPDGSINETRYDDWQVTTIDAKGHQKRDTHDAYGRMATVDEFNQGQTYTTTYAYDVLDHLTRVTDHAGNITTMTYDPLGRKLRMNDPDMGTWTYAYDAVDNLTGQTDARGVTTAFTYDALNRLTRKAYTVPASSGIPTPATVTYAYDDAAKPFSKGKLTAITDGSGSASFEYDALGRLTRESKTIDATPYTLQRGYDLLGRLTALTYPDGEVVRYTYNAQGGIETVTGSQAYVTNIDYNAAGQLTKLVYGNGVISDYTYHPQTLRLDRLLTTGPSGTLQDFTYAFDPVGNVSQITDAVHTSTQSFLYDDLDRLIRGTGSYGVESYAYDALGNLTAKGPKTMTHGRPDRSKPHAVTALDDGTTFQHDANGNLTQRLRPDGLSDSRYTFDAENRLTQVERPRSATVTVHFTHGWNFFTLPVVPANTTISALFPTFAADVEQVARRTATGFEHYVGQTKFDDFTALEAGQGYQLYCKDAAGMDLTLTGILPGTAPAKSLAAGWHVLGVPGDQPRTVGALLNNLVSGVDYGRVLRYDAGSQSLVALSQSDEIQPGEAVYVECLRAVTWQPPVDVRGVTTFVYDGDGGRVKVTTPSGTTRYLGQLYEASGGINTKHVFAGGLRIASVSSNPGVRFYHGDHLGSSNVVTDGAGQLVSVAEYRPFGELASGQVPSSSVGFTGQRFDDSTGLYFYNARYYDPTLGCFLSPDPFVQDPGDPQFLNRYAYVRNNPVRYVDPSGYDPISALTIGVIIAIVYLIAWGISKLFGRKEGDRPANFTQLIGDSGQRFWQPGVTPLVGNFQQPLRPEYPGLGTGQGGISVSDLLPTVDYFRYEQGLSTVAALVEARQAVQPAASGRTGSALAGNLMIRTATTTANTAFRMLANEPDLDFDMARLLRGVTGSGDFRRIGGPIGVGMGILATSLRVNQVINNPQLTFEQRGALSGLVIYGSGLSLVSGVKGGLIASAPFGGPTNPAGIIAAAIGGIVAGSLVGTAYSRGVIDPLTDAYIRYNRR